MERITEIVCTLGPACNNEEILKAMFKAGMNIARLNMSHGTHQTHQELIDKIAPLRKKGLKLLIDTKGPEIRIGTFKNGSIILKTGQDFVITKREVEGNEKQVGLKYKALVDEVKVGGKIFANNGLIELEVKKVSETDIVCNVIFGGKLSDHKSLNIPGVIPSTPYISKEDEDDLLFAIKNNADYIALSFVSNKKNVESVKEFLEKNGKTDIKLFAKIENAKGVRNATSILDVCDGLMVARGDLGVEIPMEKLPPVQRGLISVCNVKKKGCIVATEMLESMTNSTRPTRAEVNDVASAVYEEATATMLSGETAAGINPVLVVKTMAKIIDEVEKFKYKVEC